MSEEFDPTRQPSDESITIVLHGPKSIGKTLLAQHLAKLLGGDWNTVIFSTLYEFNPSTTDLLNQEAVTVKSPKETI